MQGKKGAFLFNVTPLHWLIFEHKKFLSRARSLLIVSYKICYLYQDITPPKKENTVIKHVVMWKIDKDHIDQAVENLLSMNGKIEGMKNLQVGKNFNSNNTAFDLILINEFESKEALDFYQNHPEHLIVKKYLKSVTSQAAVVDFAF